MPLTEKNMIDIINKHGNNEKDTGSTVVQIAIITERIKELTKHFKENKKDNNSRRGLQKLIGQRRKLLKYLMKKDMDKYRETLTKLKLRK